MTDTTIHESDPIIPYGALEDAPPQLQEALTAYKQRMGFLPNALKLYLHRPEILQLFVGINNTLMRGESSHLDAGLKRKISIICSLVNKSAYCVAHNANTIRRDPDGDSEGWGMTDDQLKDLLDPEHVTDDPMERASFAYARAATADPSDVPRDVVEELARVMTPPQVVELACVVGFWKMYNTIHESLYIPLEAELMGDGDLNDDEVLVDETDQPAGAPQARVEIYATEACPFCRRAKRLLAARGVAYTAYDVGDDDVLHGQMVDRAGRQTVPQIFIDDKHVGGMDELAALNRTGVLADLLRYG
jgi:glutaredoxin 3